MKAILRMKAIARLYELLKHFTGMPNNRIMIVGNSASGKSTLSEAVAKKVAGRGLCY